MAKSLLGQPRKKTAFIPRLAYGCVGVGMGVVPFAALSSVFGCSSNGSVGIRPAFYDAGAQGSGSGDASSVGIVVAYPDASSRGDVVSVGIRPALPDASNASDASSVSSSENDAASDASGD